MDKLLVIADDFTGALDTGVQFAKLGAQTQLVVNYVPNSTIVKTNVSVLIVNAQSRHLSKEDSYKVIYSIIKEFKAQFNFIYKKTDSGLRGNVGSELAAALDATGLDNIKFFPAFPKIGRTTVKGIHYIDGVPVSESEFAKDLFNPVLKSNVGELISLQTSKQAQVVSDCATETLKQLDAEILVFDSKTDQDMLTIAKALGKEELKLCAGCAGFASVLAGLLDLGYSKFPTSYELKPGLFVICGSLNPITLKQIEEANKAGYVRFVLAPAEKISPELLELSCYDTFISNCISAVEKSGCCIVDVKESFEAKDGEAKDGKELTKAYLKDSVVKALSIIFKRVIEAGLDATFMCIGGDTLQAVVAAIGVNDFRPVCELAPGVVLSVFEYGGKLYPMVCKSGGFGVPDLICNLVEMTKKGSFNA